MLPGTNSRNRFLKVLIIAAAMLSLNAHANFRFAGETLTASRTANRFESTRFGQISYSNSTSTSVTVWVPALNGFIQHRSNGSFYSFDFGTFRLGPNNRWISTQNFGWIYFGFNELELNGWIYSTKFGWMLVQRGGARSWIWVERLRGFVQLRDGELFSIEWGELRQTGENSFFSSRLGPITIGDFDGWVRTEEFGWVYANGDQKWFYAPEQNDWLAILSDGSLFSTARGEVVEVTPPLEDAIGTLGPSGNFVWKPISEGDHKLVVLIPNSLTDGFKLGLIIDSNGEVIEEGRYTGSNHNGNREHYRFSLKGEGYGRDIYFVTLDRSGNRIHWPIPNGAARYDY